MKRPTIADLAKVSGVSISTVNRVLSGAEGVRPTTIQLVRDKAEEINFYGRGLIGSSRQVSPPSFRLGFLLQQESRDIYRMLGEHLDAAARTWRDARITPVIEFAEALDPDCISEHLHNLGKSCDAVAVIAADHPLISQAIHDLKQNGTPVVTYITDLSAPDRAGYVGVDNWKLGRTAAWFICTTTCRAGRVAVFIGNHRYQCQDVSDASFRSYIREHAPNLVVDDSRPTHEEAEITYRMVKNLLAEQDDLVGIYIAGGGISGLLGALREAPPEKRDNVRVVCRDFESETRTGLGEGLITAALCYPQGQISVRLLETMIEAIGTDGNESILQRTIPFDIMTPESF